MGACCKPINGNRTQQQLQSSENYNNITSTDYYFNNNINNKNMNINNNNIDININNNKQDIYKSTKNNINGMISLGSNNDRILPINEIPKISTEEPKNLKNEKSGDDDYKIFLLKTTIEGHDDCIICLIELMSKKIMTGSYDKTIKIWNIDNFYNVQCEKIIKEENKIMCLLEFESNMLLIGTQSNIIKLIDINNPEQIIHLFKGHKLNVNCLVKCNDQLFASASNDTDIRIWDYYKGECIDILSGHEKNIFCLIKLNNGKLCSGGADKIIKIWDLKEKKCEVDLKGHQSWIKSLYELKDGKIISGSDDKTIKIWENNKEIKELKGHEESVKSLCSIEDDKYLISSSFDKKINIWDLNNGNCKQTLDGHKDKVICVVYHSDGYLISCSNDKTIKIWKQEINSRIFKT